jgi:hypothetical protein
MTTSGGVNAGAIALVVASLGGIGISCRPPRPCPAVPNGLGEGAPRREPAGGRTAADRIWGMTGPRCQPSDPACGPISDRRVKGWGGLSGCVVERVPLTHEDEPSGGACAHDGECVLSGCVHCVGWEKYRSTTISHGCHRIPGEGEDKPIVYCGCVAGQCDWFRPGSH